MKKTKVLVSFAALGLVAAIGIGATLAYFTDKDELTNTINMGNVAGTLYETTVDTKTTDADPTTPGIQTTTGNVYGQVVPGKTLAKDPYITLNTDSMDAYVRVKLNISFKDGTQATPEQTKALADLEQGLDIDATNWTKGDDGYYYYNVKMTTKEAGAHTPATKAEFFNHVEIPAAWGNEMANLEFNIDVVSELVQADNLSVDFLKVNSAGKINGWNISADDIKAATK